MQTKNLPLILNKKTKEIIKMGIGDVTLPLTNEVVKSLHRAVDEMSKKDTIILNILK